MSVLILALVLGIASSWLGVFSQFFFVAVVVIVLFSLNNKISELEMKLAEVESKLPENTSSSS